ncbi:MAG: N-acetylmuramoyl-L-alanine amidase [Ruminococcus sp.]|nr:N-acetylmuramoyl-L-alanine amidase [Ruminococcus sp.]
MKLRRITTFALSLVAAAAAVSGANNFKPITAYAAKDEIVHHDGNAYEIPGVEAKVKAQANGTVTLSWNEVLEADRYAAYKISGDNNENRELIGYTTDTSFTFTGVEGGRVNTFSIVSEKQLDGDNYTNGAPCEINVTQPLYAPVFSLTAYSQSVRITWKESVGATGYRIYTYDPVAKKYTRIHNSYGTTRAYNVKNLTPATNYTFVVRAVSNASGSNKADDKMAPRQTVTTKCITPEFTSLSNVTNNVTFKWKTSGDVGGYQIWLRDNDTQGSSYKKLGNISAKKTALTTNKNITFGKNYSFKLRSYKKVDGKWVYSDWSTVKSTYTGIKTPEITSLATSGPNIDISWSASDSNIKGYQLWMKAANSTKYVKLGNISAKKLTAFFSDGVPASTNVKLRMRAYRKINGAWVYSPWSKVKQMTTGAMPLAKTYKIVLDPGHLKGGNAAGNDYDNEWYGYSEATMSLTLAKYMRTYLEGYGFEVQLTRETDKAWNLDLNDRGKMAKGADFFLSLHSNAAGESAQSVYSYCSVDGKSDKIGKMLSAAVAKTMGVPDGGIIHLYSDDGKSDYYCVLRNAAKVGVSGVMVEHSYHTNAYSREWLKKKSNLKKLAAAEAKVIAQYFGFA